MKAFCLFVIFSVFCLSLISAQLPGPICYPRFVTYGNDAYIGYSQNAYAYTLPELTLRAQTTYTDGTLLCEPGSQPQGADSFLFANGPYNNDAVLINANDLSIRSHTGQPAPDSPQSTGRLYGCTPVVNTVKYCFEYDPQADTRSVVKIVTTNPDESFDPQTGNVVERLALTGDSNSWANFIILDSFSGHLQIFTSSSGYRFQGNSTFYTLSVEPLTLLRQGTFLPNTGSSGCPTVAFSCAVPVLLDLSATNDVAVWMWSISSNGQFIITVESFDAKTGKFYSAILPPLSSYNNGGDGNTDGGECDGEGCSTDGGSDDGDNNGGDDGDNNGGDDGDNNGGDDGTNGGDNGNTGTCSSQACCDASANPNYQTGAGFYKYNADCLQGGLHCIGNSGCQLCFRGTADQVNDGNRPACGF